MCSFQKYDLSNGSLSKFLFLNKQQVAVFLTIPKFLSLCRRWVEVLLSSNSDFRMINGFDYDIGSRYSQRGYHLSYHIVSEPNIFSLEFAYLFILSVFLFLFFFCCSLLRSILVISKNKKKKINKKRVKKFKCQKCLGSIFQQKRGKICLLFITRY